MSRSTLNVVLGGALVLSACVGTRTGNPYEKAPEYTTSSRFAPDGPGRPGSDGGLTGGPFGNPGYAHRGRDLMATFEHYVALAVSGRGVLTVDVVDPASPVLVGELPIDGTIHQLVAADGGVTVAVLERTTIDVTEVPESPVEGQVLRLVRVDLTDPTKPRRAFEVDLEGQFFGFDVRGADTVVVEALTESSASWCSAGFGGLVGADRWSPARMRVTRLTESAGGLRAQEAVELQSDVGGVLAAGDDAYLVVDDYQTDEPLVRWVDLAGGGPLVEGEPFAVDAKPRAADRLGEVLVLVLQHGDGSFTLDTYTLEAGVARAHGRVGLPTRDAIAVELLANGGAIIDGDGAPALLVDLSDLEAPRLAAQLPTDVMRLVETPHGLLGLGSSGGPGSSGSLVVSLWDEGPIAAPVQRARVVTDWFYPHADPGTEPWTVDADRGLLLMPFVRPESVQAGAEVQAGAREHLGVFALDAAGVTLRSEQPSRTELRAPLTDGESVFALGWDGLEVLPLVPDTAGDEPASALLRLRAEQTLPIDQLDVDGTRVALREREEDGVFYLAVAAAGAGEPAVIELPHRGDALLRRGERVVVLGLRGVASECEYFEQQGVDVREIIDIVGPEVGFDPCGPSRARGVSVITLDGPPRIVVSVPFTGAMDVEAIDDVHVRSELDGYIPLDDGRLLLFAQRTRQCNSRASCEVLGVPAYESMGTPGCSSNQDCSDLPSVITFVNGFENVLVVYLLEGVEGSSPTLTVATELEGRFELFDEGPFDLRRKALSSASTIAFTRAEPVYDERGNSVGDEYGDSLVRFFLDRLVLHEDGSVEGLAPVSTPGLAIALRDQTVFSLEPRRTGERGSGGAEDDQALITVVLHRAGLHGAGAFIESSLELGTRFVGSMVQGDAVFTLRALGDACEPGTRTEASAIGLAQSGELTRAGALELPTVFWRFASPQSPGAETLRLAGGPHPSGLLELDVSDLTQLRVVRYATPAAP
jgi:hypothetical protein